MVYPQDFKPKTLIPFSWDEACGYDEGCALLGVGKRGASDRVARYKLGRKIGRRTFLSRVAIAMHLDDNREALDLYVSGNRTDQRVLNYYRRLGLPLPQVPAEQ